MPETKSKLPPPWKSLSARLLVLTIFFVMLAEVLIYAPSIGRFRLVYLEQRLAASHLATLALEATPDRMISEELEKELLDNAEVYAVILDRAGGPRFLMLNRDMPPEVDATYDLREKSFMGLIRDAFVTLAQSDNRILRVLGPLPRQPDLLIEIVLDEAPMRAAMYDYSERILFLSVFISLITASLVFLSLHWLMVRPMQRITESMTAFGENPEDASRTIAASRRSDEIGVAQRQLARMQEDLRAALGHRARLAALGEAVAKINHDLRNILASAQLVTDRLTEIKDPNAKRLAPTLIAAIDRAVTLCTQTMRFARNETPVPEISRFPLRELVADVGTALGFQVEDDRTWEIDIPDSLEIDADREHMFRVFINLGRNAYEAGATAVTVGFKAADDLLAIEVADNGPGIPASARAKLFRPFSGTAKSGGTGLGLAIARELMRAHGGDIELVSTGPEGTVFRLTLRTLRAAAE